MLDWIAANTANIIIIAILVAVVTLVIIKLVRDKKAGRSACGGKCSGCAMGGCCGSGGDAEQRVHGAHQQIQSGFDNIKRGDHAGDGIY